MTKRKILSILNLVVAVACLCLFVVVWQQHITARQRHKEIWGPNPGRVEFETDYGGSGSMLVRDKDNAEAEVREHIAETWRTLQENPDIKIEGEIPKNFKFTKFKVE